MSASDSNSAIFMTDSAAELANKVKKYAFSGGRGTVEEHRKYGGDIDVDVPYQYLSVFQMDDNELEKLKQVSKHY